MSDPNLRLDRAADSRSATERPKSWRPPERLPSPNPKDGWGFRWVRLATFGNEDVPNMTSKLREGWEPVTYGEVPELKHLAMGKVENHTRVEVGGLLLCKMPSDMILQRQEHYLTKNRQAMQMADENFFREGAEDKRMKRFVERKSETKPFG